MGPRVGVDGYECDGCPERTEKKCEINRYEQRRSPPSTSPAAGFIPQKPAWQCCPGISIIVYPQHPGWAPVPSHSPQVAVMYSETGVWSFGCRSATIRTSRSYQFDRSPRESYFDDALYVRFQPENSTPRSVDPRRTGAVRTRAMHPSIDVYELSVCNCREGKRQTGFQSPATWLVVAGILIGEAARKSGLADLVERAALYLLPTTAVEDAVVVYRYLLVTLSLGSLLLAVLIPSALVRVLILAPILASLGDLFCERRAKSQLFSGRCRSRRTRRQGYSLAR